MGFSIDSWLNKAFSRPGVVGVILIEYSNGLCLGSKGVARASDAPILKWQYDSEKQDVLEFEFNGFVISVTVQNQALIGVYHDITPPEQDIHEREIHSDAI